MSFNKIKTGDWLSGTRSDYFNSGPYKTRKEAIEKSPNDLGLSSGDVFYTGQIDLYVPFIDTERLLEDQVETALDNCAGCEDWDALSSVEKSKVDQLDRMLNDVFLQWLKVHKLMPKFGEIGDTGQHIVQDVCLKLVTRRVLSLSKA